MTSVLERKNPMALIRAFGEAFGPLDDVRLVIKTSFGEQHPEHFATLAGLAKAANVVLINASYSRDETLSLIAACDAYVSLHRSEGLGLSLAEAMLLARPVVATRYSGNLEFMDDANSLLVDCTLPSLTREAPPYARGQRWAEPSVAQAAAHMRRLYDDREFARDLGEWAREDLRGRLSHRAAGQAMRRRLSELGLVA